jgi:predicted acyltransferase
VPLSAAAVPAEVRSRNRAIDAYRGLLLSLMIVFNYLGMFDRTPALLKHAPPPSGLTIPDLGFPMFLFILGVVIPVAIARRQPAGRKSAILRRYLRRYLLLILFGLAGNLLLHQPLLTCWSVLQTIGLAGIISLPFTFLPPRWRLFIAIIFIAGFQLISAAGYRHWLLNHETGDLGGIIGALAWAGVILIGTFIGEKPADLRRTFITSAVLSVCGILLAFWIPVSKPLVSASYIFLTTGIAGLGLIFFSLLDRSGGTGLQPLVILGINPLFVYMLSGVLSTLAARLVPAPSLPLLLFTAGLILLFTVLPAFYLYTRNLLIKL